MLATASRCVEGHRTPDEALVAEGEVPTAANLNLYWGRFSRVAWHSDNEPPFGERGDPKLIVSTSFGTRALFKWKGKSCPDSEANSCWLDHGDLLVMEWWTSSFYVRILVWNRSGLTSRSGGSNNMLLPVPGVACCLPTCAGFIRFCFGVGGERRCLGTLGALGGPDHLAEFSEGSVFVVL